MSSFSSSDEIRTRHLDVLGTDLGPVYTALQDDLTWLHAKWSEYRKLFARSSDRIDLLNESASFFFGVLQQVMWEDTLLHIARLIDPPASVRKPNLTITRLSGLLSDQGLKIEVANLVDTAQQRCAFARDWRNRHLAHRDLHLALEHPHATPLAPTSRQVVTDALGSLGDPLNRIQHHYFGSTVAYEHFLTIEDANDLVLALLTASRARERQNARLESGQLLPEDLEALPEI